MLSPILMWNKIGRIVTRLAERLDITPLRALDVFYTSKVCDRMHDEEEELYTFSDEYIVDEIILELQNQYLSNSCFNRFVRAFLLWRACVSNFPSVHSFPPAADRC